jgi:predicted NBD/HSP70 family sugar kinase
MSAILTAVHSHGGLSRAEIGARCGLSRSTVASLVAELAAKQFVIEEAPARQGLPGRPSPVVVPAPRGPVVAALEVAVDALTIVVAGLGRTILGREQVEWHGGPHPPEVVTELAAQRVHELVRSCAPGRELAGIGVAVHGLTRGADGYVSFAPNLGWQDVPLGSMLREKMPLGVPIEVRNESDLGALAESLRGAARGFQHVVYVSCEVGVGGGMVWRGRHYAGGAGYAGEVGHMVVNPAGLPCKCGSVGCWETEIGAEGLLRHVGSREAAPTTAAIDAVLRDVASPDRRVSSGLEEYARWLGIGLASLANLLNPDRIVLGGLLARLYPFVAERVEWELRRRCMEPVRDHLAVVPAILGRDSAVLGAVELAFADLLGDPWSWRIPESSKKPAGSGADSAPTSSKTPGKPAARRHLVEAAAR